MTFQAPTLSQLPSASEKLDFHMTDSDLESFLGLMAGAFAAYEAVDQMSDNLPAVKYSREPGYRPPKEDNPLGAWYMRTSVKGAPDGKLKGRTVVLKDNVCLAGIPMMGGVGARGLCAGGGRHHRQTHPGCGR